MCPEPRRWSVESAGTRSGGGGWKAERSDGYGHLPHAERYEQQVHEEEDPESRLPYTGADGVNNRPGNRKEADKRCDRHGGEGKGQCRDPRLCAVVRAALSRTLRLQTAGLGGGEQGDDGQEQAECARGVHDLLRGAHSWLASTAAAGGRPEPEHGQNVCVALRCDDRPIELGRPSGTVKGCEVQQAEALKLRTRHVVGSLLRELHCPSEAAGRRSCGSHL